MRLAFALGVAALSGACAGSPVEAEPTGASADGSGDGTSATGSSPSSSTPASATSPDGSGGELTGDPTGDPTGEPTGDPAGTSSTGTSASTHVDESSSSSAETTGGGGGGCLGEPLPGAEPEVCSMNSLSAAELEIDNGCAYGIEVFWVNFACDEVSYQVISGGNSWSVSSFVSHPWRIRDVRTGALILEIPPLQGDTSFVVQ